MGFFLAGNKELRAATEDASGGFIAHPPCGTAPSGWILQRLPALFQHEVLWQLELAGSPLSSAAIARLTSPAG
jgi:hypothetical protein